MKRKCFIYILSRLSDCFHQNLRVEIENDHPLPLYKYLNLPMHQADYFNCMLNYKHRKALSRHRLPSHRLGIRIEYGRYDKKCPIDERICIHCNLNDVEDEYHIVLLCDFCTDLRKLCMLRNTSMYDKVWQNELIYGILTLYLRF